MAVRVAEAILSDLGSTPHANYWGRYEAQVRAMLEDRAAEIEDIVKIRIDTAKAAYTSKWGHLKGEQLDERLSGMEVLPPGSDPERVVLGACPACGRKGHFIGDKDFRVREDWDYGDGAEYIAGVYYVLELIPNSFGCQVCGLFLPAAEFLVAAGLPYNVHVRSATEDEYLAWDESEPAC